MDLVAYNEKQKAVTKHAQSSYKKGKRPAIALEEDEYVDSLSHIIKRDFFPDLSAHDDSGQKRGASSIRPASTRMRTPRNSRQDESFGYTESMDKFAKTRKSLSLDDFQARYTSEDNASFQEILDDSNLKRRERYSWLYKDNKIHTINTEFHEERLAIEGNQPLKRIAHTKEAQNALMFSSEGIDPQDPQSQQVVYKPAINHRATSMPNVTQHVRPDSPTNSLVGRALRGELVDEPQVGGFTFVATPVIQNEDISPFSEQPLPDKGAFKMPDSHPQAETLDKLTRGLRQKRAVPGTSSPLTRLATSTPKFKSSPVVRQSMLSPAAHRMLGGRSGLRDRLSTPKSSSTLR